MWSSEQEQHYTDIAIRMVGTQPEVTDVMATKEHPMIEIAQSQRACVLRRPSLIFCQIPEQHC